MLRSLADPPREFTVVPLWFWNDALTEDELVRQIDDFQAHGVYGFMIHPRVGLPRAIGWMSDRFLHFMHVAIEEARRRGLLVFLYDEGMYPSGASSGQVVASDPALQSRGLDYQVLTAGEEPALEPGHHLAAIAERASGTRLAFYDRPTACHVRGLHYTDPDEATRAEDEPTAADLLNPAAVACFIRLVYDRFAEAFGEHFGTLIRGIFTDEPNEFGGKCRREKGRIRAGTTGVLEHVERLLGYDFTPRLPALWFDGEPEAARARADYSRAMRLRLHETYYRPLSDWCDAHGIALCGHPQWTDDLGSERFFQIPGQDLVHGTILPGKPDAIDGRESVQAKCVSSSMVHLRRRQCSEELLGAYGHTLTYEQMKWLTDWCLVRGINLLFPHAFFYSVRGHRRNEAPPDVGPNSPWWDRYRPYADYCRRLCYVGTDARHVCDVAILADACYVPWRAARVLFTHQRDFNYLEARHLWEDAQVDGDGIRLAGMHYHALIVDGFDDGFAPLPDRAAEPLRRLEAAGRVLRWPTDDGRSDGDLVAELERLAPADLRVTPSQHDLRYRHVVKDGVHCYLITNEGVHPVEASIEVAAAGRRTWIDPFTLERRPDGSGECRLAPYSSTLLCVEPLLRSAPAEGSSQDELQGSVAIIGDIVSPVVPADEWHAASEGR